MNDDVTVDVVCPFFFHPIVHFLVCTAAQFNPK